MSSSRPAPWVSLVLYGAVLVAGVYADVAGLSHTPPLPLLAILAALYVVDFVEHRLNPILTLVLRIGLILAISMVDESGLARILFVLVPFTAYFAFGRLTSIALGIACIALAVATTPGWYADLEQVSDLVMFTVGLLLTITMAAVAADERRLRHKVAELSAAAERNRLARDIHDGLGHHLTTIVIQLEKATAFRSLDSAKADQAIEDARASAKRALDDVRQSVQTLRTRFDLSGSLADLVTGQPDIALEVIGDETEYPAQTLTALFRAAQEGITNSRRHADASRISVSIDLTGSRARLTVDDDGRGFACPEGFGLLGMRERVGLAGGRVEIASEPGAGTRLTVTIPRQAAS
ncbi:signal transduction histidine kinase [Kibdelosporangium banguiense]|uniref:histidine kinase n=1 Tax=Kibdelosporangium banguiense TaxID=1365924 RepID=A0ABS4U2V3_9PSEU|nr:sensor histidine kinase [Kibdelosporangium banguiense]MBP2330987.1 signal transduction histidine kinase [Kibdelosporangium banguiense]